MPVLVMPAERAASAEKEIADMLINATASVCFVKLLRARARYRTSVVAEISTA